MDGGTDPFPVLGEQEKTKSPEKKRSLRRIHTAIPGIRTITPMGEHKSGIYVCFLRAIFRFSFTSE